VHFRVLRASIRTWCVTHGDSCFVVQRYSGEPDRHPKQGPCGRRQHELTESAELGYAERTEAGSFRLETLPRNALNSRLPR
jgi:hypothetical protein